LIVGLFRSSFVMGWWWGLGGWFVLFFFEFGFAVAFVQSLETFGNDHSFRGINEDDLRGKPTNDLTFLERAQMFNKIRMDSVLLNTPAGFRYLIRPYGVCGEPALAGSVDVLFEGNNHLAYNPTRFQFAGDIIAFYGGQINYGPMFCLLWKSENIYSQEFLTHLRLKTILLYGTDGYGNTGNSYEVLKRGDQVSREEFIKRATAIGWASAADEVIPMTAGRHDPTMAINWQKVYDKARSHGVVKSVGDYPHKNELAASKIWWVMDQDAGTNDDALMNLIVTNNDGVLTHINVFMVKRRAFWVYHSQSGRHSNGLIFFDVQGLKPGYLFDHKYETIMCVDQTKTMRTKKRFLNHISF